MTNTTRELQKKIDQLEQENLALREVNDAMSTYNSTLRELVHTVEVERKKYDILNT